MSVIVKGMEMPKNCSDCPLNYDQMSCSVTGTGWWSDTMVLMDFDSCKERLHDCPLIELPPAEPEHTCVNCGRTANNGGWYADGRTRCPIEEHYALPKDGYCHLWEKRNVTDDDYPERREEVTKTGRHFDIEKILEEMRHD